MLFFICKLKSPSQTLTAFLPAKSLALKSTVYVAGFKDMIPKSGPLFR